MRRLLLLALSTLVLAMGAGFVYARLFAGGPVGMIPGGHLRGTPARELPRDWSFANRAPYLLVESDAWTLPYSASVWFLAHDGRLHLLLPSFFGDDLKRRLGDDPRVRVEIDGKLYDQVARPVTEDAAIGALTAPFLRREFSIEIEGTVRRVSQAAELWVYRLDDPAPP